MAEKNGKKQFQLTNEGKIKLENELKFLREVERPRIVEAIVEARQQGDLSENADYHAARDEQAEVESRIKEIENILSNVQIIDETSKKGKKVSIGRRVELEFIDFDEVHTYHLVGNLEADPLEDKISNESPLGSAILGRSEEDVIKYKTDTGKEYQVKILKIK